MVGPKNYELGLTKGKQSSERLLFFQKALNLE